MKKKIRYLKHSQIDKTRWDESLEASSNRTLYAYSWYLDCVCPGWHALVQDDYEAIMPLPTKKKYGLPYIFEPPFTQQLGIFSHKSLLNEQIEGFFEAIPKKFVLIKQKINAKNDLYPIAKRYNIIEMPTYLLNLYRSYDVIYNDYKGNIVRNLKRAKKNNLTLRFDTNIDMFLEMVKETENGIYENSFFVFEKLLREIIKRGKGECVGVFYEEQLIAGALILRSFNRFIYLVSASREEGKKKRAMFLLLDEYFKLHVEQKRFFDFEGSVIPGIASFYQGFGAHPEYYSYINYNRLYNTKLIFGNLFFNKK